MGQQATVSIVIRARNLARRTLRRVGNSVREVGQKSRSAFRRAASATKRWIFSLRAVGTAIAAMGVLRLGKQLFKWGSTAEETGSKFRTVFGQAQESVQAFIDDFANLAGLSEVQAQEILATTGAIAQGMGFARQESAAFAQEIVRTAGDLASFNNIPITEVARGVQSALAGEREQMKRLGIIIREADVQQQAMAESGKANAEALSQQERAAATLTLIQEKAGVAMGDLLRTQDSAANTARRVQASFLDLRDDIAKQLLPAFAEMLAILDENRDSIEALGDWFGKAISLMGDGVREFRILVTRVTVRIAQEFQGWRRIIGKTLQSFASFGEGAIGFLESIGVEIESETIEKARRLGDEMVDSANRSADAWRVAGEQEVFELSLTARSLPEQLEVIRQRMREIRQDLLEQNMSRAETVRLQERLVKLQGMLNERIEKQKAIEEARGREGNVPTPDVGSDEDGDPGPVTEALNEYQAAAEQAALKTSVLGQAFNAQEARVKALEGLIGALTEAGVGLDEELTEGGLTLRQLGQQYRALQARIAGVKAETDAQTEAQKRLNDILDQGRTPLEEYRRQVGQLKLDLLQGHISVLDFVTAVRILTENLPDAEKEVDKLEQTMGRISDAVQGALIDGLVALGETIGTTLAGVAGGMQSLGKAILNILGGLLQTVGKTLISFGVAGLAIKSFIANPAAAIAAGVAMVALGSALQSAVSDSVGSAGTQMASGATSFSSSGASPTGAQRAGAGQGGQPTTLILEGDPWLDMTNPDTQRRLGRVLSDLTGRRVVVQTA